VKKSPLPYLPLLALPLLLLIAPSRPAQTQSRENTPNPASRHWLSQWEGYTTKYLDDSPFEDTESDNYRAYYTEKETMPSADPSSLFRTKQTWEGDIFIIRNYDSQTAEYRFQERYSFDGMGRLIRIAAYEPGDLTPCGEKKILWYPDSRELASTVKSPDKPIVQYRARWNHDGYLLYWQEISEEYPHSYAFTYDDNNNLVECRYDCEGEPTERDIYTYRREKGRLTSYRMTRRGDTFELTDSLTYKISWRGEYKLLPKE
jgi:hypothetical protein